MWLRDHLVFRRNILLPSSGLKCEPNKIPEQADGNTFILTARRTSIPLVTGRNILSSQLGISAKQVLITKAI
jgi:hypothetical protein